MGRIKSPELFKAFRERLKAISNKENCTVDQAFIHWYIGVNYRGRDYRITDRDGDGFIDAVIALDTDNVDTAKKYVVLQAKHSEGYIKPNKKKKGKGETATTHIKPDLYQPFDQQTIPAFRSKAAYSKWLTTENVRAEVQPLYQRIFDARDANSDNVRFEFITTHYSPTKGQKPLKHLRIGRNFKGFDEIFFIFDLQQHHGDPPADPIDLDIIDSFRIFDTIYGKKNDKHQIETFVARFPAVNIINYMTSVPEPSNIISRNVRDYLPGKKKGQSTEINENLRKTYENDPEQFWYSHNGITIICNSIDYSALSITGAGKITLTNPNVINGAQTVRTLEKSTIQNSNATLLVKIFVITPSDFTTELIQNVITRANTQNAIFPRDLRANTDVMFMIQAHFGARSVYFERRRGDKDNHKLPIKTDPYYLSKLIMISKLAGGQGILKSKENKEQVFKSDQDFEDIFKQTRLQDIYFMFIVRKLFVEQIFSVVRKFDGKRYLLATINGIIWQAIINNTSKLSDWKDKVDYDQYFLSFKQHESLKLMKDVVGDIKLIIDRLILPANPTYTGKFKYRLFMDKKDGKTANDKLLLHCRQDIGGLITKNGFEQKKRDLGSSSSQGIMKDVEKILTDHFDRWDNCPNCRQYTERNKPCTVCTHQSP